MEPKQGENQGSNRLSDAESKEMATLLRQRLEEKIGVLSHDLLLEFGAGPKDIKDILVVKPITDWPDSFGRNTWYKTWAKSGAASLPSEDIASRASKVAARKLTEE